MVRCMSQLWLMINSLLQAYVASGFHRAIARALYQLNLNVQARHSDLNAIGRTDHNRNRQAWRRFHARHFRSHRNSRVRLNAVGAI